MFAVAKVHEDAKIPVRAHDGDAGMDLSSIESLIVPPRDKCLIDTGIAISIPSDCYARVAPRSGLAVKYGIDVLAGVVDSSYRNTIKVLLFNNSDTPFQVEMGDRIAQLILEKIYTVDMKVVPYDELSLTDRGEAGFGSTGR
jgi:dUTP pyrophosphatase